MAMQAIAVKHNIEVAHRLSLLPGACQNIHGHSMIVELKIRGEVNGNGILAGLDFGAVKKEFRHYLDTVYDHHLLLNAEDPWAAQLSTDTSPPSEPDHRLELQQLPGLQTFDGDPTTENIAKWIGLWAFGTFGPLSSQNAPRHFKVTVHETAVNAAEWEV